MKRILPRILAFFIGGFFLKPSFSHAEDQAARTIKGTFRISEVKMGQPVVVEFFNVDSQSPIQKIVFRSDSVHKDLFSLNKDKPISLRAVLVENKGTVAEASQVLLNLPRSGGRVMPIVLVSTLYPEPVQLSSGFLELHSPELDFLIL